MSTIETWFTNPFIVVSGTEIPIYAVWIVIGVLVIALVVTSCLTCKYKKRATRQRSGSMISLVETPRAKAEPAKMFTITGAGNSNVRGSKGAGGKGANRVSPRAPPPYAQQGVSRNAKYGW